jgi:hypothetical protein
MGYVRSSAGAHDAARELFEIVATIVRHGGYVVFQLAEVAVARSLFASILRGSTIRGHGRLRFRHEEREL